MKHINLFIFLIGFVCSAQKVSNIAFRQEQSNIIVSYDLETKTPCKVSLYVSTNAGVKWQGPLTKVTGSVGNKIVSGSHNIIWNVLEEFDELKGNNIKFQVRVTDEVIQNVTIGTQFWMLKNLDVSTYRNGDIIPEVKDSKEWENLKTGAWCYYDNDPKNGQIYGKLYNWYAVNDSRGLAPRGYHIPTVLDINKLINYKDNNSFSSLLGGCRNSFGIFATIENYGNWWSSSNELSSNAWYFYMNSNDLNIKKSNYYKTFGFSIRCVKDKM